MHIPKRSFHYFSVIGAGLGLLICCGCTTLPEHTTEFYTSVMAFEPVRSPVQIDGSAAVEAVVTLVPTETGVIMQKDWEGHSLGHFIVDANIANYRSAVAQMLRNDLSTSGLFARIVTNDTTMSDYLVKALYLESQNSDDDFRVKITLSATETATGAQVSSHAREVSLGEPPLPYYKRWKDALPGLMAALKADLAADLQENARRQQQQNAREEVDLSTKASLSDLLASVDKTESSARKRNLAIVAAKNHQLPAILREKKTDGLSALVVKIEQTILELNHECEVAKDRAQEATATNGYPRQIDELRGLAICYRERIELLKPILTALKDEIANRNR